MSAAERSDEHAANRAAAIARLVHCLRDATPAAIEAAVDDAGRLLASGERLDDLVTEAILDGLRFGCRAAVAVELRRGMMVRIIDRGGVRITHELTSPGGKADRAALSRAVCRAIGRGDAQ